MSIYFKRYLPILFIILYLISIQLIFFIGPIKYPILNPIQLILLFLFSNIALFLGYSFAIKDLKFSPSYKKIDFLKLFKISIFVNLIFIPLTNYANIGSFFPNISQLNNLGDAYKNSLEFRETSNLAVIFYFRALISPILFMTLPLGIFYWKELNIKYKVLFVITVIGILSIDIFRGTNKGLADFAMISIFSLIARLSLSDGATKRIKYFKIKLTIVGVLCLAAFLVIFSYFSAVVPDRYGVAQGGVEGQYYIDDENFLLNFTDEYNKKMVTATFVNYFVQGLHSIDLAMEERFTPTWGFGHSMFLIIFISDLFQTDYFYDNSYIYKIDESFHWDSYINWSSFYTWVASDVSFYGVPLLLMFLGYIYGKSWVSLIYKKNIISLIVFILLSQCFFYLTANNQIVQSLEGFVNTYFWIFVWVGLAFLRKIKWPRKKEN